MITALNTCRLIDHTHLFKHFSYLFFLIHAFGTKKCVLQQQGNFSNSSTETRSGTKLTFQHRLLLLFVILPDHMTIPRKSWFPVLQAFVVYFAPITWFKKKKKKELWAQSSNLSFPLSEKSWISIICPWTGLLRVIETCVQLLKGPLSALNGWCGTD